MLIKLKALPDDEQTHRPGYVQRNVTTKKQSEISTIFGAKEPRHAETNQPKSATSIVACIVRCFCLSLFVLERVTLE